MTNPVRAKEAQALQDIRDAAEVARIDAWKAALNEARLAKLLEDLEVLGVSVGEVVEVIDNLLSESVTAALSAKQGHVLSTTKANLNSPALTGTPTAPTAEESTNTTQIATTQFAMTAAQNAIELLVGASPALLDTLYEFNLAINSDPEFATHVAEALGLRLRVDAVQSLSALQQSYGRDNLALGTAALLDEGDLPTNHNTANSNSVTGTNSHCLGGSGNTISGNTSVAINCVNCTVNAENTTLTNCKNVSLSVGNAVAEGSLVEPYNFTVKTTLMAQSTDAATAILTTNKTALSETNAPRASLESTSARAKVAIHKAKIYASRDMGVNPNTNDREWLYIAERVIKVSTTGTANVHTTNVSIIGSDKANFAGMTVTASAADGATSPLNITVGVTGGLSGEMHFLASVESSYFNLDSYVA